MPKNKLQIIPVIVLTLSCMTLVACSDDNDKTALTVDEIRAQEDAAERARIQSIYNNRTLGEKLDGVWVNGECVPANGRSGLFERRELRIDKRGFLVYQTISYRNSNCHRQDQTGHVSIQSFEEKDGNIHYGVSFNSRLNLEVINQSQILVNGSTYYLLVDGYFKSF